jgi:hypothetical protein
MQYILTQDEYDRLKKQISNAKEEYKGTIDYLCMLVANHMPLTTYPGTKEEPEPWDVEYQKTVNGIVMVAQ